MSVDPATLSAAYPFRSRYLSLDGVRFHYLDEGRGESIVLLHGNPTWSFYYRHLVLDLSADYRVLAPDHIGCGLSDKPQTYDYCLERHIANLEALLEPLALDRMTLVIHDWGGPIGMGYAVRHPERVARFVVFNTAAFWLPRIPWFLRVCRLPGVGALVVRRLNLFALSALYVACRRRERLSRQVRSGYLGPYDSYANRIALLRFVEDIPVNSRHRSFGALRDIEAGLAKLRDRPMLVVWGGRDPVFTDSFLAGWIERFPQASVDRIDEAGHYVVEDAHERIIPRMREFLRRHPA